MTVKYEVILKRWDTDPEQVIVLAGPFTFEASAQDHRKLWRAALGGRKWTVDRRPGKDTLDCLMLTVRKVGE